MKDESAGAITFDLDTLSRDRGASGRAYLEFLRVPAMSGGLYVLPAGTEDRQQPHTEDEVYVVLRGQARFRSGDEDHAVAPGSVLFVPANVEHQFHSIEEE